MLTRRTYIGTHEFNRQAKDGSANSADDVITVAAPPLIDPGIFEAVQRSLRSRDPKLVGLGNTHATSLLTGVLHCHSCGGKMAVMTAKSGQYSYYVCGNQRRQGRATCTSTAVRRDQLDEMVAQHIEDRLLAPERLETILRALLDRREIHVRDRRGHVAELNKRAAECQQRLSRIYDAIESGVASLDDPELKDRIDRLKAARDEAKADGQRAEALLSTSGRKAITPEVLREFATRTRQRLRRPDGRFRRQNFHRLAQRVEVHNRHIRIVGSKADLFQTLMLLGSEKSLGVVPPNVPKWLRG